jgi:type III secretory pathway component EscV
MDTDVDIQEIKQSIQELNRKFDELLEEKEVLSVMKISEEGLKDFIFEEPDIYSIKDLRVRYR